MTRPTRVRGGWEVRLRIGGGEKARLKMPDMAEGAAQGRVDRLEVMRDLLRDAADPEQLRKLLTEAAAQSDDGLFAEAELVAQELAAGADLTPAPITPRTFRDVCTLWTSGALHERFPDRVPELGDRRKRQATQRLGQICETIGGIALSRLTKNDCESALSALPKGLMASTRSEYARLIPRVLRLAVLAGVIEHNPLPEKWAPRRGERREFQLLYPSEDAQLIQCPNVPWERRLLWGFLVREGLRISEALALVGGDIDLEKGTIVVRTSKTGRMRRWRLGEDVRKALVEYQQRAGWGGSQFVFPRLPQGPAATFRSDLWECRLRRRELHKTTAESRQVTVHDLRGSFVTMALATGKPLPWIMRRTGHRNTAMVDLYQRAVDFAVEHEMQWFGPLDLGLIVAQRQKSEPYLPTAGHPARVLGTLSDTGPAEENSIPDAESTNQTASVRPSGHPINEGGPEVGPGAAQTKGAPALEAELATAKPQAAAHAAGAPADPVESALAFAIEEATKAQRWDVVLACTTELRERRIGATPGVSSLEAARAKKNGDRS